MKGNLKKLLFLIDKRAGKAIFLKNFEFIQVYSRIPLIVLNPYDDAFKKKYFILL